MAVVLGAVAGTLTSFALNRLFPPEKNATIKVEFDQERLHAVLERLGADFARVVDRSIHEALLKQNFQEIKAKIQVGWRCFADHCATVTPEQPRGDEAALSNASLMVEQAYASLKQQLESELFNSVPDLSSSRYWKRIIDKRVYPVAIVPYESDEELMRDRDTIKNVRADLYRHLEKAKAYMLAYKTLVSLNLMIIARRCDLFPGLKRIVPDTLGEYRMVLMRLREHYIKLQKYRVKVDEVFNLKDGEFNFRARMLLNPECQQYENHDFTVTIKENCVFEEYRHYEDINRIRCVVEGNGSLGKFTLELPMIEPKSTNQYFGSYSYAFPSIIAEESPKPKNHGFDLFPKAVQPPKPMDRRFALYAYAFLPFIAVKLEEHSFRFAATDPLYKDTHRLKEMTFEFQQRIASKSQ